MIHKQFDLIEQSDIDALVSNAVPESRTLDYKESLPGNSDSDKKEFLADVSSFANASGGDILFGVEEVRDATTGRATGIPQAANGLMNLNADAEILRLENMIRDGIEPRIPSIQLRRVESFVNGPVLLLRILKSWASPHMVKFGGSSRFYSRNSAGKYPLDVTEIRAAFALSEALPERIRRFRDDRLAKIIAGETPIPLVPNPKIVLHFLPVAALETGSQVNLSLVRERHPLPMNSSGANIRFNFNGVLTFDTWQDVGHTYLQVFRNGAIEAVEAHFLSEYQGKKEIDIETLERELVLAFQRNLALLRVLELQPPVFVMLTLLGVKDYIVVPRRITHFPRGIFPIDQRDLFLPELIVEDYNVQIPVALKPAFDAIWQASGYQSSMYYDQQGKWKLG